MMVGDAALLTSLVMRVKGTVMVERMGASMTVTGAARGAWSVEATTA